MKRPLVCITICYITGIASAAVWQPLILFVLFLSAIIWAYLYFKKQPQLWIILFISYFLAGAMALLNSQILPVNHLNNLEMLFVHKPVLIKGKVISYAEQRQKARSVKTVFYLRVQEINNIPVSGKLITQIFRLENLRYGDIVEFTAKVAQPFDSDNNGASTYSDYLRRKGVFHVATVNKKNKLRIIERNKYSVMARVYDLRQLFLKRIEAYFSKGEAGFMKAILLGDRSGIPDHVEQLFLLTGTVHIIAISGLHITLIAGILLMVLRITRLPRNMQFFAAIIVLIFYSILAGGRDSVIRSVLMFTIFIFGKIIERENDILNSLAFCALIILILLPQDLFEIGFQLSFMCVLMIILLSSRLTFFLEKGPFINKVNLLKDFISSFSVSLGVWIGIWPLIAYYFLIITPVSLFANLLIVPLSLLIILLGTGFLFVSVMPFGSYFAGCFAECIKIILASIVKSNQIFTLLPGGYFFISDISLCFVIIYYILLAIVVLIINFNNNTSKSLKIS